MTQSFLSSPDDLLTLFSMTPDLVCIAGENGYFIDFNPAVPVTLGYTRDELFSHPISYFMHPEDREMTLAQRAKLLKGESLLNFQNRYLAKNGNVIWLEWTSVFVPGRNIVFAIAKNITSRKNAEMEMLDQVRNSAAHFKSNLEKDRKLLAAELHEELAQLAYVLKIEMDTIRSEYSSLPKEMRNKIDHAYTVTDLFLSTIQRISFSISPSILEDLGLEVTIEWYCTEYSKETGINYTFFGNYNEEELNPAIKLDLFRICQEVLMNIKLKAKAKQVNISIEETHKEIILIIRDNGKSCWFEKDAGQFQTSIQARVASMSASFEPHFNSSYGNEITIKVPKDNSKY